MPQQALGRDDHQRLAPAPEHLPPQAVEVLGRRGGHDDLDVVVGRQVKNRSSRPLECSGPMPLETVRQQQHQCRLAAAISSRRW